MAINYGKLNAKMTPRGSMIAHMGVSGPLNSDYEALINKPQINGNELIGNKTNEDLGIPTKVSDLDNDLNFVADEDYVHTDNNYDDTDKGKVDALKTASTKDVPAEGNASASEVVMGSDTRLTDSRPASDVYDWAKAQTKPSYSYSEIQNTPAINNSTIIIQKNNQNVDSFTLNQDSNKSINISVPTKTSDLQNDNSFITNTVNNLANYYLKTQTYTQAEVDALIQAAINGRFQKVNTLPASGEPNVIYLVPKTTPETSNACDEYIWQDNAWELIGSTEIDLSDYVTDEDLATALQSYLTTSAFATAIANYYTKTEVGTLLNDKVDKVNGKGLSTYDYDATAKAIVDSVTANLATKVDKVAGKGLSTNDYDNTAKNIVDGVTSALAGKVDKVDGKGLSTNDYTNDDETKLGNIAVARFGNTAENQSKKIKIKINNESRWMLAFTVTLYKDYKATKVMISGYNFTTSYWHQPKAVILGKSYDGNVNVYFGYDSVNNLWVGFDGGSYKGVSVSDVANGFQQISNYDGLFTISEVDTLTTLQTTLVATSTTRVESSTTNGNIKIDNEETQVYDDSDIQGKISTTLTPISGNPISISGLKSTQLAVDPVITFEPIQDLHGQSKPYPAGGGKNLYNTNAQNILKDTVSISNEVITASWVDGSLFMSSKNVQNFSAGTYTLTGYGTNLGNLRGWLYIGSSEISQALGDLYQPVTFTTTDSFWIGIGGAGGSQSSVFKLQLESGSASTTWSPYENICPISGYDKIEVLSCGKNLFDKSKVELGKISTTTGEDESASDIYRYKDYIYLKSNTRYTIGSTNGQTVRIYYYSDNAYIGTDTFSSVTSIDTGNNIKRIRFQSREFQTVKEILQIEEGATASTYESYHKTTDLSENLPQTVYGGSLDVRTGIFTVTHAIVDLGEVTFIKSNDCYYKNFSDLDNKVVGRKMWCSAYEYQENTGFAVPNGKFGGSYSSDYKNTIFIGDNRGMTATEFKTAMAGQKLVYPLATPFTIQLTPHEISLLEQYAYLSTNGSLITLSYHQGEMASLGDVEELYKTIERDIVRSQHAYSTTEQVVGTWIDGKPIYEKVIPVTTTAQSYRLDVSALNIDYVVFIKVRIKNVNPLSQSSCDYPYWYSNTDWFRYYFSADNKSIIFESGRDFSYGNGYVILQYTKNTD